MQAPTAERRPKQLSTHNDVRSDPYYWLRDDEREDPAVSGSHCVVVCEEPAALSSGHMLGQMFGICTAICSCAACPVSRRQTDIHAAFLGACAPEGRDGVY
jgi:Prolyl oligopeptidase, N-terminal beta-propeller domain